MENVPIPDRLKGFSLYKGMLVHFTVFVGDDGLPDFKVVHEANRLKCMREKLCAICGQPLENPMVFIGGERSIKSSVFLDGPMHEECALYSTKVCPYLKIETWAHTSREPRHKGQPGIIFKTYDLVPISRPRMGLYYTDGYEIVDMQGGLYYHAAMPFYVTWDAMPQPQEAE